MKIKVDVIGEKEIAQALQKLSVEKKRKVKGEVYSAGHDVRTEAMDRLEGKGGLRAWDTGHLATSIIVERSPDDMIAEVGPTAPYGPYVEYGTKPHFPPFKGPDAEGLERWARKHGFDSVWPICLAIAKRGLPARPFLFPAWLAVKDKFWKRIREILVR